MFEPFGSSPSSARRLAVMQPYFFPYLGYFQLAAAVDDFIFLDDVGYIRSGWINRNRLEIAGTVAYFTVPVCDPGSARIHEVEIVRSAHWKRKLLTKIQQSYAKAPQFEPVFELITGCLGDEKYAIGSVAARSVEAVCGYLGLATRFYNSSGRYGNEALRGQARVIDICRRERAKTYVNLPGGRSLYDPVEFERWGIELMFIEPRLDPYPRSGRPFVPGLSILDLLMYNDRSTAARTIGYLHE